jgi:hypothetical protein
VPSIRRVCCSNGRCHWGGSMASAGVSRCT